MCLHDIRDILLNEKLAEDAYDYAAESGITTTYDITEITYAYYKYTNGNTGTTLYDELITFKGLDKAIGYVVEYYDYSDDNSYKYVLTDKSSVVLTKLSYPTDEFYIYASQFKIYAVYADGSISSAYSHFSINATVY